MKESIEVEVEKEDDKKEMSEYEIENAMDTLLKAEVIKKDSKLMAKLMDKLNTKKEAINSIQGLKAKKAKLQKEDVE